VRPDTAAFRELDAIVRKLTEQLAGYRRRALSAELRTRDLEQEVSALQVAIAEKRAEAAQASEAREHALAAAREASATAKAAQAAVAELERAAAASSAGPVALSDASSSRPEGAPGATADELSAENERLRARLTEARDRTAQLADRVRFLRQQMLQGAER